ncbi:MAG: hypothetical protein CFH15_01656 [Alphaproteobacteria bacterium MarineAlpha5_Bin5]|nr:MAG: hypothetical protein CFH15_01656 [Alphaproteobacteria bacterium MarineAlpha5_Bin5]PPR48968.1 MAG: hypothetical protein CFH14_01174 [Alphaproteobacteria bacterium MarineAlpha5_Bin4]|tara:strand:+ start:50 stop:853 length:804 start_codon:yes stop_codon:yes gene_type:complete
MLFKQYLLKQKIGKFSYFIWDSEKKTIKSVNNFKPLNIKLIIGIDNQKKILLENTINFTEGNFTNNALLWGARGNGKSTLIKSVFNKVAEEHKILKLVQLNKNNIFDIEIIYNIIGKFSQFRFILFIDDLSFENIDSDYKIIKSTLDGSIQNQPKNILLYVTSNRRHLMSRDMIDNERSSAIHTDESVDEKISLSDRFGIWIGFHKLSQEDYLKIIKSYCLYYKIDCSNEIETKAIQWSLQRGNRNGRTAWQFILDIAAKKNLKIDY